MSFRNCLKIKTSQNLLVNHLLGLLFIIVAGYQIFINEFQNQNFIFYYYNQNFSPAPSSTFLIAPFFFLISLSVFWLIFYICKLENDLGATLRKVLSAGLLVYIYILFLTLQQETMEGSFFWPLGNIPFPYKEEYIKLFMSIFFLGYYCFSINTLWKENSFLGKFNVFLFYSPLISFLFSNFSTFHLLAWIYAAGIIFLSRKIALNPFIFKRKFEKNGLIILILLILITSFAFRYLTISYFRLFGLIDVSGMAADGPHSYQAAWSFMTGVPTFSVVPYSYSLLLFILLKITHFNLIDALTVQSLITCATPLLIFFICRKVFGLNVALIALICSAFSYELLHFSVVVHRTALASLFLTLSLLILIKSMDNLKAIFGFLFGFIFGWTVLLEGLLAPLAILCLVPLWGRAGKKKFAAMVFSTFLGFLIAELTFNVPLYDIYKTIMPLGRSLGAMASWFGNWVYGGHQVAAQIMEINFNPFDHPGKSLEMFLEDPIGIGTMLVKKILFEVRAYFLGHNSIFLDPFLMKQNSYFASALSFFYIPVFIIGFFSFIFSKTISWRIKVVIALPFIYHFLFHSVVVYSYARYRGIVMPIIIVFFSLGIFSIFKYLFQVQTAHDSINLNREKNKSQDSKIKPSISLEPKANVICFILLLCVAWVPLSRQLNIYIYPPISHEKTIVKAVKNQFLWKDQDDQLSLQLLSSKNNKIYYNFTSPQAGKYNISVKFSKQFGPSLNAYDLVFDLNDSLFGKRSIPKNSSWINFENIKIKKGGQTLSIQAVSKKNKITSFALGEYPEDRNIKIIDLIISPT